MGIETRENTPPCSHCTQWSRHRQTIQMPKPSKERLTLHRKQKSQRKWKWKWNQGKKVFGSPPQELPTAMHYRGVPGAWLGFHSSSITPWVLGHRWHSWLMMRWGHVLTYSSKKPHKIQPDVQRGFVQIKNTPKQWNHLFGIRRN